MGKNVVTFPIFDIIYRFASASPGNYRISFALDPVELSFVGMVQMQYFPVNSTLQPYLLNSLTITAGSQNKQCMYGRLFNAQIGDTVRILWLPTNSTSTLLPSPTSSTVLSVTSFSYDPLPGPLYLLGNGRSAPVEPIIPRIIVSFQQTLKDSSGQIIFYLTSNGAATGTPIFPQGLFKTFPSARPASGVSIISTPSASENTRDASNNLWVQINVTVPLQIPGSLLASGSQNTVNAAPLGTIVQLFAIGW